MPMTRLKLFTITRFVASYSLLTLLFLVVLITLMSFVQLPSPMLMFSAECDTSSNIYLLDMRVYLAINLTHNPVRNYAPIWSPDGTEIAFISDYGILRMNIGTGEVQTVASRGLYQSQLAWSNDGSIIAFIAVDNDSGTDLFVVNADGSNLRQITDSDCSESSPSWRP